jgi:hypothetical protein
VCEFRAKQLWLTTPLAMKSPVPVVMSYIGSSMPRGSMAATRSFASLFSATPPIDRFRVIAGSVVWKNRMTSLRPPRSRTTTRPFGLVDGSSTWLKPSTSSAAVVLLMISGLMFETRQMPLLWLPSASKMPARKPQCQSLSGASGQRTRCSIARSFPRK